MSTSSNTSRHEAAGFPEFGWPLYLSDPEQIREYLRGYALVAAMAFGIALLELVVFAI
jgi:hypothetical protein